MSLLDADDLRYRLGPMTTALRSSFAFTGH
jgi:hypothetical protein